MPYTGPLHFSHIADLSMIVVLYLSDPYVVPSFCVCDVERTSFHFGL